MGNYRVREYVNPVETKGPVDQNRETMNAVQSDIEARVIALVAYQLEMEPQSVNLQSNFVGDLGADSLDTVQLTFELEKEFGVTIADDVAARLQTVGDAVTCIENALRVRKR